MERKKKIIPGTAELKRRETAKRKKNVLPGIATLDRRDKVETAKKVGKGRYDGGYISGYLKPKRSSYKSKKR